VAYLEVSQLLRRGVMVMETEVSTHVYRLHIERHNTLTIRHECTAQEWIRMYSYVRKVVKENR